VARLDNPAERFRIPRSLKIGDQRADQLLIEEILSAAVRVTFGPSSGRHRRLWRI
jgi:hypothetical protein